MCDETAKTLEWMLLLENKKKRPHRLAHEIGAGAPCLSCGDACPGLDLHFWRKLCRNCKCKKEEHDVRDDEGYEQFEILFASSGTGKKKRVGAFLNFNVPDTATSVKNSVRETPGSGSKSVENKKGVAFDWVPPDVPEDVAAEYMQQLPASKLPISGSDGALYRRQQLEKQVPLHDLDATKCHGLSEDEIAGHQKYLENLKNNVVGQGRVMKLPGLYKEQLQSYSGPAQHQSHIIAQSSLTGESRPIRIATSQSAQCLKSLPSIPLPRPFNPQNYNRNDAANVPPPLPDSLPPGGAALGLRMPSSFLPSSYHNTPYSSALVDAKLVPEKPDHGMAHSTQVPHNLMHGSAFSSIGAQTAGDSKQVRQLSDAARISGGNVEQLSGIQTQTHASDGIVTTDQQAHDTAYSTEMPLNLPSQQSKVLNFPKNTLSHSAGSGQLPLSDSSNSATGVKLAIPTDKQSTEEIVTTYPKDNAGKALAAGVRVASMQATETISDPLLSNDPLEQDGVIYRNYNPTEIASSYSGSGNKALYSSLGKNSVLQPQNSAVHPSGLPDQESFAHSDSVNNNIPQDRTTSESQNAPLLQDHSFPHAYFSDSLSPQDAAFVPYSAHVPGHVIHSTSIGGDSMPKSAHVMQQKHAISQEEFDPRTVDCELAGKLQQLTGLEGETPHLEEYHLNCHKCNQKLVAGELAVLAERAGKQAAWHPQCFVCCTCEELLVDLIYFYYKGDVYCGRHYAELLSIPRCFACDELIFVKEYTCAEGKAFHVKHFCCYDCDIPLGGKQYIPKDNQPVCLECFQKKYGKSCHTCRMPIAAGDQRVGWKDLSWHVSPNCFCCSKCFKSLLGGKFLVKNEQPFCSKECAQTVI